MTSERERHAEPWAIMDILQACMESDVLNDPTKTYCPVFLPMRHTRGQWVIWPMTLSPAEKLEQA